jgi:hypothetical protein
VTEKPCECDKGIIKRFETWLYPYCGRELIPKFKSKWNRGPVEGIKESEMSPEERREAREQETP